MEYGAYVRSKYDFADEATRFFYDHAEIMYKNHTQTFNKTTILTYFSGEPEKLSAFQKYGGNKTISEWIKLAVVEDTNKTFEVLKKYSLLREYQRKGFDISRITEHKKFDTFTATDIYRLIRGMADRVHTVILTNQESEILNHDLVEMLEGHLVVPDMGIPMCYPILNDVFRGVKYGNLMAVGMLSNAGKSRFMFKLIAYLALVQKQKVLVLLNEMSIDRMKLCLITTVINNDCFQELHGVKLGKKEKELALGLYKNGKGEYIYRKRDKTGNFTESIEDYQSRLLKESSEYQNVMKVAEWVEKETEGLIFGKDVSNAYDDKSLEHEIRKMNMVHGVKIFFYDTLKNDTSNIGEWSSLVRTTTMLSEVARDLDCFGYASCQLTDDTNYVKPHELTSSHISAAKNIKHILDSLILCKEIQAHEKSKYAYLQHDEDWGNDVECPLKDDKRYYIMNVDKNREGFKPKVVFEVDLDRNTWYEKGRLVVKR